ncbi:DUF4153 domain-containing protein [Psychroserpens ponticola]|uniref:DUF4173 domain-containing protein n=1 Tax=Psychroserpens ponticola TaxID=2932268 RepID=A0ABY7RVJ8_9FLAO|nr:DUF4173 domain-containing protein [Psychroserpens ponticola]WCO00853.1 DUF4173 domain-containing protein [Psychroserpens ponticola]
MKQTLIIIASILSSFLFFEQSIGINLLIFSIITIIVLAFNNLKQFKDTKILLYCLVYVTTSVFVFIQDSSLSIFANCVAFFTLIGKISQSKTSIYINWLNGVFTSITGLFFRRVNAKKNIENTSPKKEVDFLHIAKLIGIPTLFIIVFVLLYKNGNPMFNDLVEQINFNFINFQWLLFTVLGYYLISNIVNPIQVEPATSNDLNTKNNLYKSKTFSIEKLKKEKQLGTTLLGLLNLLIILFIVTDIASLMSVETIKASDMSTQVHNGINTLIASIIIAIVIILHFFRGDLNFYSENKTLKNLTYLWILLNVVLIALIAIKNQTYITSFGLTYKRIGVHIYIFLTLVGLITTFIKVMTIKNMVFLFRLNTQIVFAILILFSAINWDTTITKYNLDNANSYDLQYLINLSDANAILLKHHSLEVELDAKFNRKIDWKYNNYLKHIKRKDWQEKSLKDYSITEVEQNL